MTQTNAVASSPVLFFTDDGRLIQIPIATIKFTDDDVFTTLPADASTTKLHAYLKYLASTGELVRDAAPPPVTALVATAAATAPGPIGNRIVVQVKPATDPAMVDVKVTQIDVYTGLKLSTIEAVVGNLMTPGSSPGLFRVKTNTAATPPRNGSYDVDEDAAGAALDTWTIVTAAGSSLVLEPILKTTTSGYKADDFTVVITDVNGTTPADTTFTLTVTWSHEIDDIAAPATATTALPAAFEELRYLATFTPATGWKLPRPGTTTLTGGRAASTAQSATTTLLANA